MIRRLILALACVLLLGVHTLGQQVYSVTIGSLTRSFATLEELKSFVATYEAPAPDPVPQPEQQIWPPIPPNEPLKAYTEARLREELDYTFYPGSTFTVAPVRIGTLYVDSPRAVTKSIYRFDMYVRLRGYAGDTFEGLKIATGGTAKIWMPTYVTTLGQGRRRESVVMQDQVFWTPVYADFRNSPTGTIELRVDSTIKHSTGHTTNLRYPLRVGVGVDGPRASEAWGFLSQPEARAQSAYFQGIRINGVREFATDAIGPLTITASARNATDNAAVGNRSLLICVLLNGAVITERTANSGVSSSMKFSIPHPPVQPGDVLTAWLFDASQPDQGSAAIAASVTVR